MIDSQMYNIFFFSSPMGCASNNCLTCNSGRAAIGAFCALKSEAIAQNVTKELSDNMKRPPVC